MPKEEGGGGGWMEEGESGSKQLYSFRSTGMIRGKNCTNKTISVGNEMRHLLKC